MPKGISNSTFSKTSISYSGLCWRPSWTSRFESLWSLLRKVSHLNATTHTEIRKLFRRDDMPKKLDAWRWCLRADLRLFGALDPNKISNILGIDLSHLAEAIVSRFVHEHEAGDLTSNFLRFCPTCISQGFHSTLYQLLFLNKCPAHGDQLVIRCVECLSPTIPYKFQFISGKDVSKCVHMLNGLTQHLKHGKTESLCEEASERTEALLSTAEWVMKRVDRAAPEQPINMWVPQRASQQCFTRHVRKLPTYWIEVFGSDSNKKFLRNSKLRDIHIHVRHKERPSGSEKHHTHSAKVSSSLTDNDLWDLDLYRTYKSIKRHLLSSYFRRHRRCIVEVGKHIYWDTRTLTWAGAICPAANALLLWSMFLEGVDQPSILFRPHRAKFNYPRPRINWDPPSSALSAWVLKRIFALDCIGVFQECLLLTERLYRHNTYSFQLGYIRGRRRPHWLIEKREGDELILHWWVSRSLSSLFSRPSASFRYCKAKS